MNSSHVARHALGLLSLATLACSDDGGSIRTYENEGRVCLESATNGKLEVEVHLDECRPCGRVLDSSCSVEVEGERIVVSSHGAVELHEGACTLECTPMPVASCQSGPVDPGEYELVYGEDTASVTLPAMTQSFFGESDLGCD